MNKIITHRGPDYMGEYVDEFVSLGHNLLSIRDNTSVSRQPVYVDESPWVLAFNGQIYNTTAVKKLLPEKYRNIDLDTTLLLP
jgi:asparagine synthase (glutamine-hydrolysing)